MPTGQYKRRSRKKPLEQTVDLKQDLTEKAMAFQSLATRLYLAGILSELPTINWDKLKEGK